MSSDGNTIVYGKSDGKIFISTNKGLTFNRVVDITNTTGISTISVSSDGYVMFASINASTLFISFNKGRKWYTYTNLGTIQRYGEVNNNILLLPDNANDRGIIFNLNKDLIVRDSLTDSNIVNVFDDWLNDPMDNKFIDSLNNPYYGVINEWNMTQINNYEISENTNYNWRALTNLGGLACYDVKMNYSGQYIYLTTSIGILRSDDYGENWHFIDRTQVIYTTWQGIALSASGDIVYIVANSGNYMSTDYGITWSAIPNQRPSGNTISVATSSTGQYVCSPVANGADSRFWRGIWCSSDYGVTWSHRGNYDQFVGTAMSSSGQYTLLIATPNGNPRIWISNDYMQSFSVVKTLSSSEKHNGLNTRCAMSSSGQYMITGVKYNIYVSSDYGQTWNIKFTDNNITSFVFTMDETGQRCIFLQDIPVVVHI